MNFKRHEKVVLLSGLFGTLTDLMEQNYGDHMKSQASMDCLLPYSQSVFIGISGKCSSNRNCYL